jgi:hypothetical protein
MSAPGSRDEAVSETPDDPALKEILRSGAPGAVAVAGTATAIVVALWLAFYLFVFVPRAGVP